jgi:hypothetical protein
MARRVGAPTLWTAATACAVISLIAPLGWSHSYAYALPLFVLVTARAIEQPQRVVRAFIASCWIALIIPAHRHFAFLNDLPILWHLTYSRYALATLGMIGLGWHRMITMPVVATKKSCPSHKGRAASIDQC